MDCGEATAAAVDDEVMRILKDSYEEAKRLLLENREVLDQIAAFLIEKETITGKEFMQIFRKCKGIPEPEESAAEGSMAETSEAHAESKTEESAAEACEVNAESKTEESTAEACEVNAGSKTEESTAEVSEANAENEAEENTDAKNE